MIRATHAGLGKVRLALAHIRVSVGRPFKALYLRPIIFTTNPERVKDSPYHWVMVERAGVVHRLKGLKYAPRSMRRRARIGGFLAKKLGLEATKFDWREYKTSECDKWALSLKGIIYSWLHPRQLSQGTYVPKGPGPARPWSASNPPPRISRVAVDEHGRTLPSEPLFYTAPIVPPGHVDAIDGAWEKMTVAERKKWTRKAASDAPLVI